MMHDSPGGTKEQYEEVGRRLTDGRGLNSLSDWPVDGILSHAAGPTNDGWRVVDVWESEDACNQFGEVLMSLAPKAGLPKVDGVMSVDPAGLAALLQLTGPVQVDDWDTDIDSGSGQVRAFLPRGFDDVTGRLHRLVSA